MRYNSLYTIKELDYKTIESRLSHENISVDLRMDIEKLIADHKAMVEYRNKIIEEQNAQETALFNLFEDPILQPDLNNPLQALDNQPDNSMQIQPENKEEENKNPSDPKPKKRENGGKKKLPLGNIINHSLLEEEKKCAGCGNKMHKQRSKTKTYVLSLPLLSTETHISESCRCLSCDTQATATRSDDLEQECIGRYHFSAVSALASLRYQCGMASYRMETMSDALGIKIADSTQWSLFEHAASLVQPFICFLEKEVANAPLQHMDDTHNIIHSLVKDIEAEQEEALLNGKNPENVRCGIHTTNLTGVFPQGQIVLYKTGLHHAGEILSKIFAQRTLDEQIIIMMDAASSNTSQLNLKEEDIKIANCNSHTVRKFKELAEVEAELAKKYRITDHKTSEYLDYFLSRYKIIFENDKKTKNIPSKERLLYHQNYSLPLMLEMKGKVDEALVKKVFEPNEKTGKVYQYFFNHFEKLRAFCDLEGAPVCNNLSERMLKSIIRHRRNSLFFKTQIGANVSDNLTSILFTAKVNGLNSVEYLKNLLIHQVLWKENPQEWLPWNYIETINKLKNLA